MVEMFVVIGAVVLGAAMGALMFLAENRQRVAE